MASYIKGIYGYIRPESNTEAITTAAAADPHSPTPSNDSQPEEKTQEVGYLRRAVSGVASGIYTVGSSTVGAGVSSVKWVAGTTYNVSSGVVGTAGAVVGTAGAAVVGTAGAVVTSTASTVGAGATAVISKITTKKKEHSD